MGGGEEIPLSVLRPCRIGVLPNELLDKNSSPHLTIDYLDVHGLCRVGACNVC